MNLVDQEAGVYLVYFYFDYGDRESMSPAMVIRSLAKQLLAHDKYLPEEVLRMYEESKDSSTPDMNAAQQLFLHAMAGRSTVYIVLDALDECEETRCRKPLIDFLYKLQDRRYPFDDGPNIRIFVTSRHYPADIQEAFSMAQQLQVEAHSSDVRAFLQRRVEQEATEVAIDDWFKTHLIDKITESSEGLLATRHYLA